MKDYWYGFFKLLGYGLLFLIAAVVIIVGIILIGITIREVGLSLFALADGDFLTFFKELAIGLGIILFLYTILFFYNKWVL